MQTREQQAALIAQKEVLDEAKQLIKNLSALVAIATKILARIRDKDV